MTVGLVLLAGGWFGVELVRFGSAEALADRLRGRTFRAQAEFDAGGRGVFSLQNLSAEEVRLVAVDCPCGTRPDIELPATIAVGQTVTTHIDLSAATCDQDTVRFFTLPSLGEITFPVGRPGRVTLP